MTAEQTSTGVVFYHDDAKTSNQLAKQFCHYVGRGRLATVTDIIDLKLNYSDRIDPIWNTFFSTTGTEYYGKSKGGSPLIIVGHGVGPLCNEERFQSGEVIDGEFVLSKKEFLDLESGKYGYVDIFDYESKRHLFENPYNILTLEQTLNDEFAMARLGPKGEKLLRRILKMYMDEFKDHTGDNRFVFKNESNYRWTFDAKNVNTYRGNFLSFDALMRTLHSQGGVRYESFVTGIDYDKSLSFPGRFVAIEGSGRLSGLEKDYLKIFDDLPANLETLLVKDGKHKTNPPYPVRLIGDKWFTLYLTEEDSMLSGPQHTVTKIEKVKGPTHIKTKCNPSGVLLCSFELKEVQKICPPEANAFSIGDIGVEWKSDVACGLPYNYADKHIIPLTFYKIEVDTSRRVLRSDEVKSNFQHLMRALKR